LILARHDKKHLLHNRRQRIKPLTIPEKELILADETCFTIAISVQQAVEAMPRVLLHVVGYPFVVG
jgi:hypothetical protein